jgi:hypothetical protein
MAEYPEVDSGSKSIKVLMRVGFIMCVRSHETLGSYCHGFPQGIAGRQAAGCVLVHVPRNSTVEAFPSCPRMHV